MRDAVRGDYVLIDTVESSLLVVVCEASQLAFAALIAYPDGQVRKAPLKIF